MAKDILAVPATSVPFECVFSGSSRIIGKYRNSLKPESVEALICLKSWNQNGASLTY